MEKLNINEIIHDSIVDGDGIRSVIFFQGCEHHCKNCHNSATWSIKENKMMSYDEIMNNLKKENFTKKVTLSGGDPLLQYTNLLTLLKKLKAENYNVWLYTGFTLEEIKKQYSSILKYVDIIVDGKYEDDKRDISLKYRGSSNQCIYKVVENEIIKIDMT